MTIKIENNQLFETAYIEDIIKKNIPHIKVTTADLFGLIKIERGEVTAEVQCHIINNDSFQHKNVHDPFIPQHGATFVDPVTDTEGEGEEEKEIEGSIEITSNVKTSYWIRFVFATIILVPCFFYLKQMEASLGERMFVYVIVFGIAGIPKTIKRRKYAKVQKELQQLLINLINEHNLTSSPEEKSTANDDDDKYNLSN